MEHSFEYVSRYPKEDNPDISMHQYSCIYCGQRIEIADGDEITQDLLKGCEGIICPLMSGPSLAAANGYVNCQGEHCGAWNRSIGGCNIGRLTGGK